MKIFFWHGLVRRNPTAEADELLHESPGQNAAAKGLKLKLQVEIKPEGGVSKQKLEETKAALRELGLPDNLTSE